MRIIIECPENILHLEAGYIYADCLFDSSTLLQSGGGPYILANCSEGNPVNDGVVFRIRAVANNLAVKILSDTPAGDVLYGDRIEEATFAESCISPLNQCGHDFPAKALAMRAFLEPKAQFWRNRIRIVQ